MPNNIKSSKIKSSNTKSTETRLTFYIPELFGLQSALSKIPKIDIPLLTTLEKWLSRGEWELPVKNSHVLYSEFGISPELNPPLAALCLLAEDPKNVAQHNIETQITSHWLRADPVCMQPDRDTAIIVAYEEIALSAEEAALLVNEINTHFSDESWQLYALEPNRWYLRVESLRDIKTHSLERVLGQDISDYTIKGNDAAYWEKCINEVQMLLHSSNINFERESRGLITANSLWIWGEGSLTESNNNSVFYDRLIANNILYSGVAKYCGISYLSINDEFITQVLQGKSFVVFEDLISHTSQRELYSYIDALKELEVKYISKVNDLLKQGTITEVILLTESGLKIRVTAKLLKRWWKRIKPFQDIKQPDKKHVE